MRNSRILIVGIKALSNEILKNIVLAGVCHVTMLDWTTVNEQDLGGQFFLRKEDIGKNVTIDLKLESRSGFTKSIKFESSSESCCQQKSSRATRNRNSQNI